MVLVICNNLLCIWYRTYKKYNFLNDRLENLFLIKVCVRRRRELLKKQTGGVVLVVADK